MITPTTRAAPAGCITHHRPTIYHVRVTRPCRPSPRLSSRPHCISEKRRARACHHLETVATAARARSTWPHRATDIPSSLRLLTFPRTAMRRQRRGRRDGPSKLFAVCCPPRLRPCLPGSTHVAAKGFFPFPRRHRGLTVRNKLVFLSLSPRFISSLSQERDMPRLLTRPVRQNVRKYMR